LLSITKSRLLIVGNMILDEIVANKKLEIAESKRLVPLARLKALAEKQPPPLDFAGALRGDSVRLIAEVKKASPSKGVIRADFNPIKIAKIYAECGAAAISVLTDNKYFQGYLKYVKNIKKALAQCRIPLLRKDFIIDPYQVYESRAYGADALLLISEILDNEQLKNLLFLSTQLGMACLVEIHNTVNVIRVGYTDARIIGINNRDLNTMTVDIHTTETLRQFIPRDRIVVSESGIRTRDDVMRLEAMGVNAVLIGEALMASGDIPGKIKELLGQG